MTFPQSPSSRPAWTAVLSLALALLSPGTANATNLDCGTLKTAIMASYNANATGYSVTPGNYVLTNPNDTFSLHLYGLHRTTSTPFTIDFGGSTLTIPEPTHGFFLITNSEYVTIKNATIQYQVPPFTQGTIQAISGNQYQVQLDAGYPDFNDPARFVVNGITAGFVFDPATSHFKAGGYILTCTSTPTVHHWVQNATPGNYTFTWDNLTDAVVGDRIVLRGNGAFMMYLHFCSNMTVSNLTATGSPSFAIFDAGAGDQNTYSQVTVTLPSAPPVIPGTHSPAPVPGTATALPLISGCADGIHSDMAAVGPVIDACSLSGMLDDAIAVHGSYSLVAAYDGNVTLTVTDGIVKEVDNIDGFTDYCTPSLSDLHFYADSSPGAKPGNEMGTADLQSFVQVSAPSPLPSVIPPSGFSWSGHTFYQITLQAKPAYAPQPGDLVACAGLNGSGYLIENCTIGYHRARGIIAKADNGTIENCVINGSSLNGIMMQPEDIDADYSHHVQIMGNTIENCGYEGKPGFTNTPAPAFALMGFGTTPSHADIVFANNTIANQNGANLYLSLVDGLEVTGNHFSSPGGGAPSGSPLIVVADTNDVTLQGNWISNPGPNVTIATPISASGTNTSPIGLDGADLMGNLIGYTNPYTVTSINGSSVTGKAIGFQVQGTGYTLSDILLDLNLGTSPLNIPIIQLWSANATHTAPGTPLETLSSTGLIFDNIPRVYDFTSSSHSSLAANGYYYVVVTIPPGKMCEWRAGSSAVTPSSPAGLATPTTMVVGYGGAPSTWTTSSSIYNWIQINGNP